MRGLELPLETGKGPDAQRGWTTKQKVLAAAGIAVLFGALVALVYTYRGHPLTTGAFRGASE